MGRSFDAIVIGTGQAGPSLARRLADAGQTVAVIERHQVGGTCVNTGCIPTKAMVASARAAHVARRTDLGVTAGDVRVDVARVTARAREISKTSRDAVTTGLESAEHVTFLRGHAQLTGKRSVTVNGETLTAERIFLNVGARASVPEIPGLDDVPFLTNSSMIELDALPRRLVIVGGSYVGLEFGQMFRRFGSEVVIVERGERLIGREDAEVSDAVREFLEGEGIEVRLDAQCIGVERKGDGVAVKLDCAEGPRIVEGSHLLLAIGRVPNTADLGLETAGVERDARGYVKVDDFLETNVAGIFALGDCNGRGAFTHTSYDDGVIVAANLLDGEKRRVTDRVPCYALYVDPPLGRCGMTEREARAAGKRVLVGRVEMENVGRAFERGETTGFLKAVVDADSKQILGASFLGIEADEVIHVIIDVMRAKAPYTLVANAMHIHPTVSEYLPVLFQSLE